MVATSSLPPTIPIFPLADAVLFPSVFLPLHIFEPRYREMVADALRGDRIIGMVLLRPGWEPLYEGRPAIYPIGCAGLITHAEKISDGRYNIILTGLGKFRVLDEDHGGIYRTASIEAIVEAADPVERREIHLERQRLETVLLANQDTLTGDAAVPTAMPDDELINGLAQYLALEPVERQALLEREGMLERCRSLIELLEMKVLAAERPWNANGVH